MARSSATSWAVPARIASLLLLPLLPVDASVEDPGLLATPPMGFNNWARFECDLNETLFTETAQSMNRLNLDDCWMAHERAANGALQWNTTLFPHGIPWLADYAHQHGFHLGIYEDSGNATCGGYPGSYEHEQQDAETFASWGIDYLKLDGCNVYAKEGRSLADEYKHRYGQWHRILSAMSHPLIFSESAPAYFSENKTEWASVMDWIPYYGELARHSTDILVYVGEGSAWDSIMVNYGYQILVARYQQPGYYNDPDFLIPDHPGLTDTEKRSHFALWASFGAPLIISAYIPALSDEEIEYLSNKDLIAVDQDPLAQQAALVSRDGNFDVLTRLLANGDRLLTVLNTGTRSAKTSVSVARLGLDTKCQYKARDLLTGQTFSIRDSLAVTLDRHAVAVYRITPGRGCTSVTPTGMIFNTVSGHCLTASSSGATFAACSASDAQVWRVAGSGTKVIMSPLSDESKCLAAKGSGVALVDCKGGAGATWSYFITGHLQNANGQCLTEASGQDTLAACELLQGGQILGLPSGVHIVAGDGK
ncbi:uncharacterized protein N7482_006755 [Penicillium canariense]|uniref:Alpha-galactosidase n=1 Tax=Penicillium canariense TaxID=189055 RepID=A0A9W9LJY2_9EURO|nr:uncharacterized protein N7482_006755 [Penicillium canariense]KAJ5159751.1 hypothetical protein N7482_006755 [Penicillium canariense]